MKGSSPQQPETRLEPYMNSQTTSLTAPYFSFISPCLNLETESLIPEVRPDKGLVIPASSQLKDLLPKFCCKDQTPALTLWKQEPHAARRQWQLVSSRAQRSGLYQEAAHTNLAAGLPPPSMSTVNGDPAWLTQVSTCAHSCWGISQTKLLIVPKLDS